MILYTDLEEYGKYKINGLLKLNETVYESGVANRYTWKYNLKLHEY